PSSGSSAVSAPTSTRTPGGFVSDRSARPLRFCDLPSCPCTGFTHRFSSMISRVSRVTIALAVLVAGCGKSTKDQAVTEPKLADPAPAPGGPAADQAGPADGKPAAPVAPVRPPAKAAPRGPEHAVYALVDNRLS